MTDRDPIDVIREFLLTPPGRTTVPQGQDAYEALALLERQLADERTAANSLSADLTKLGRELQAAEAALAEANERANAIANWEFVAEANRRAAAEANQQARDLADALRDGVEIASRYMDTERGDLDGWIDHARAELDRHTR